MPLPLTVHSVPRKYKFDNDEDGDMPFKSFLNILQSSTVLFNQSENNVVTCFSWNAIHYPALKLSLVILTFACVVPHKYQLSSLIFRTLMVIGCGTHLIWGLQLCSPDIIFWNSLFIGINVLHCLVVIGRMMPSRLSNEHFMLYEELFKLYKVDKDEFKNFVRHGKVTEHPEGDIYAKEQISLSGTKLSLLISGRIIVSYRGSVLYDIQPFEFFDCHEWIWRYYTVETINPRFQVTLTAAEPCRVISWSLGKMDSIAQDLPHLFSILRLIISSNALKQMYSVIETNHDDIITTRLFSVS